MRCLHLLSLILTLAWTQLGIGLGKDGDRLPTLLSAISERGKYHIMFQVHMLNSNERLSVEEWAWLENGLHRIDLVSENARTTYLTNAKTGEIFTYRPYRCSLIKEDAEELKTIAALFKGYPIEASKENGEQRQTVAYGLGPLWLNADSRRAKVEQLSKQSTNTSDVYLVDLNESGKDFDFKLKFYFKSGLEFVDSIDWVSGYSKSQKVLTQVRAKVIQMPGDEPVEQQIFDLPAGYGCVRSADYDHPFKVKPGPRLLDDSLPDKALLEVSLSYPKDASHHCWQTNRYSLSVARARIGVRLKELARSYYATLVQFRDPSSGRLKRERKVWSDSSEKQAVGVLYTMDPDTGRCQVSQVPPADRLRLDFPSRDKGAGSQVPIRLSLDLLEKLFNANLDEFHLIDFKPSAISNIFKDATYEKRMSKLHLDDEAEPLWSGPVSVIREMSLSAQVADYPQNSDDMNQLESYHTKVSILLYSDDLSQVQYKISFSLFENPQIDMSHMQQELDISSCLADKRRKEIMVKYPIEDDETRSGLESMQSVLLELFSLNLFATTPIEPLSVSRFELSFDPFNMMIKFELLDIPLWQIFPMKPGSSLYPGSAFYEKLSSSLDSCSEACEHHTCRRFAFSETKKRCQLELGLERSLIVREDMKEFVLFEAPAMKLPAPWIVADPSEGKRHLRPHEMLEVLRHFVLLSDQQTNEPDQPKQDTADIPLTIRIERFLLTGNMIPPQHIALRPVSVQSSLDDMNEIMAIVGSRAAQSEGANSRLVLLADQSKLRAEYSIVFEDRDFSGRKEQADQFTVSSYEDCAANCDDFNCRSFSYCELTKTCTISRMHDVGQLERSSKHSFTCTISVLDYLTKFEPFGATSLPIRAKQELEVGSERDCAALCVENQLINCQAFYFCPAQPHLREGSKCYLDDVHLHDTNPKGLQGVVGDRVEAAADNDEIKRHQRCNLYSRSYLAQFDQLAGKSLDSMQSAGELRVESDLGPDACARLCIEQSCAAFDVCLDDDPEKLNAAARRRQVCRFARSSITRSDLSSKRKSCSTFVLSDRSHLGSSDTIVLDVSQLADYKALDSSSPGIEEIVVDGEQRDAEDGDIMASLMRILSGPLREDAAGQGRSIMGGSRWLSRFLCVSFGLLLGAGCAIFWSKKADGIGRQFGWTRFSDAIARI